MNKVPCGCRTVENEDGNISAVVDRSECQMDATTDAYLQMVELKQKYELEADHWKKEARDWRSLAQASDKAIDAGTKRISELMQEIASLHERLATVERNA